MRLPPGVLLLVSVGSAGLEPPRQPPAPDITASPLRFSAEGLTTAYFTSATARLNVTGPPPMCIITPYRWGTDFGQVPHRGSDQLTAAPPNLWRWNGSALGRGGGATTKVMVEGMILNASTRFCCIFRVFQSKM